MKLFRKNKIQWQGSTHERDQEVAPVAHDTTIHLSAKFEGVITSKSNIFIYGEVIGDIFAEQGHLVVHRTAKVVGNLYARSILIEGRVEGVCVAPYLKISSSAHVNGRVKAYRLLIDEGARFVGFSEYVVSDKKLSVHEKLI